MNGYFFMEHIDDWFDVTAWPRWLRRAFVLTLPISAPTYAAAFCAMILTAVVWWIVSTIVTAWK